MISLKRFRQIKSLEKVGYAMFIDKKFDDSLLIYYRILELDSENFTALYYIGNALRELGELDKALVFLNRALIANPDDHDTWHITGNTLEDLGKMEEALEAYAKGFK
jgi:tetratricopeptide (TPR) repeat protein